MHTQSPQPANINATHAYPLKTSPFCIFAKFQRHVAFITPLHCALHKAYTCFLLELLYCTCWAYTCTWSTSIWPGHSYESLHSLLNLPSWFFYSQSPPAQAWAHLPLWFLEICILNCSLLRRVPLGNCWSQPPYQQA